MADFYHVYLRAKPLVTEQQIEASMNLCADWFKYAQECYVVYTTADAKLLESRFRKHVRMGGNLFICKLDKSKKQGWMPKEFWDWINKKR